MDVKAQPLAPPKVRRKKFYSNEPVFGLRQHLYRIFGVDLTVVPGMNVLTTHTLLAEVGPDLSKFRSASAFVFWLELCPDKDVSGGKVLSVRTRRANNRATWAFRMAANALYKSQPGRGVSSAGCAPNRERPRLLPLLHASWLGLSTTSSPAASLTTRWSLPDMRNFGEHEPRPSPEPRPERWVLRSFQFWDECSLGEGRGWPAAGLASDISSLHPH